MGQAYRKERGKGDLTIKKQYSKTVYEQERRGIDVELPLQAGAHLSFHLINLPESKPALTHNTPQLFGIGVVADDLGGEYKCENK